MTFYLLDQHDSFKNLMGGVCDLIWALHHYTDVSYIIAQFNTHNNFHVMYFHVSTDEYFHQMMKILENRKLTKVNRPEASASLPDSSPVEKQQQPLLANTEEVLVPAFQETTQKIMANITRVTDEELGPLSQMTQAHSTLAPATMTCPNQVWQQTKKIWGCEETSASGVQWGWIHDALPSYAKNNPWWGSQGVHSPAKPFCWHSQMSYIWITSWFGYVNG